MQNQLQSLIMVQIKDPENILAIDVGSKRVGLAISRTDIRMATPLLTLEEPDNFVNDLIKIIKDNDISKIVVGLPRGLDSQDTDQTKYVKEFVSKLENVIDLEIIYQDEALTSVKAEEELTNRNRPYSKSDVDKLAACYILEDYLSEAN